MTLFRAGKGRVLLVGALVAISPFAFGLGSGAGASDHDALTRRVRSELKVFTDWLSANRVEGYIGEVGWPDNELGDSRKWNALAHAWYRDANAAGLWVTTWATGEWWGKSYKLAVYEDRWPGAGVDSLNTQARVVESYPTTDAYGRGVNVSGGEFAAPAAAATSVFSNANPGIYGINYHYDSQATFNFLAKRGVKVVRVPFRWERLQPVIGQKLDASELQRLKDVVARARAAGLQVILDMHNYGAYYLFDGIIGVRRPIGTPEVPIWRFAEIWGRISLNFKNDPAVVGYGLMNEPVGLSGSASKSPAELWEQASQSALDRIRSHGDRKLVLVSGYNWSGVQQWTRQHPDAWIDDATGNFRYESHHYWDRDNSGDYPDAYDAEVADAAGRGF